MNWKVQCSHFISENNSTYLSNDFPRRQIFTSVLFLKNVFLRNIFLYFFKCSNVCFVDSKSLPWFFIILFKWFELKRGLWTHHVNLIVHHFMRIAHRDVFTISFKWDIFSRPTCIITRSSDWFLPLNMNVLENIA